MAVSQYKVLMTMQKSFFNWFLTVTLLITANQSLAEEANPQVMLKTEAGDMVIELYPKAAPGYRGQLC
jgi:hypothetical protein